MCRKFEIFVICIPFCENTAVQIDILKSSKNVYASHCCIVFCFLILVVRLMEITMCNIDYIITLLHKNNTILILTHKKIFKN